MITATLENFQTGAVQQSHLLPVLVDLGSPRSPISQTLTTLLIRLETEYGGAFTLATTNCDLYPQIAQAFQVQTVPTCILLNQGQPIDGFSGGLNEVQVRDFLNKHIQAITPKAAESKFLALAKESVAMHDLPSAIANAKAAIQANADFVDARLLLAALLMDTQPLLAQIQCDAIREASLTPSQIEQYALLKTDLAERIAIAHAALESPDIVSLKATIAVNGKDLPARLALAHIYQSKQAYELALEQLLVIVQTDRTFKEDVGRKTMIDVFALASETPDLVRAWRQKLSTALN